MGVVFRARHLRLNRVVALKMALAGAYAGRQERERFQREAEAVAGLQHPNVVQIHDVGESEGQPYFTMELVEGGNLAQKLAGTPQPALEAARILSILAGAVQAAHESGILHRDLKPGNVLLTSDGTPKISDFGLARRLDNDPGITRSGTPLGTPSYMAPEQAEGKIRELGAAVDVYALGALLYELLTGRPPFRAETATATLQQVIAEDPAPPSRLNTRVPRDLETICLKCLRKDPEKRYGSARELIDDLGRFTRGEPVAARPVGMTELLENWLKRRPAAAGLLVAVTLLVGTGSIGAWQFFQQASTNRERQAQTDREVSGILDQARFKLEEGWQTADLLTLKDAQTDASRAADVARSGGASPAVRAEVKALEVETAGRLARATKNHSLLNALLDVSASNEISTDTRVDEGRLRALAQPSVDEQYAAAFRAWGLDVDGASEDEVASQLSAEPAVVGQEIVAALDNWILERRRQPRPMVEWRRLVRLSERLDASDQHRRLRVWLIEDAPSRVASVACLVGSA